MRRIVAVLALLPFIPLAFAAQQPLALEPIPDISQDTKTDVTFTLKVKPADAPQPRFSISKVRKNGKVAEAPKNSKLDAETGSFSWTPTPSQAAGYEITFTVKDAKDNEANTTVKLTVRERPITAATGEVANLLKKWHAEGTAAGNSGDYYDNRDGDHSPLPRQL